VKKDRFSTEEILKGIEKGDNHVLRFVYDQYFEMIEAMVIKQGGARELAEDIFQESLLVIYKKAVQDSEFTIQQSSFFTYFYAVCRLTLLNFFKREKRLIIADSVELNESYQIADSNEQFLIEEGIRERLFHKYLEKIPVSCIKIIQLAIDGFKASIIAEKLGLSGAAYVRKRKKYCLETLIEMIKKDPNLKEL